RAWRIYELKIESEVKDSAAVIPAEQATAVATKETTAIAHVSTSVTHVAAGIPDFASCCCLTGVTHARHTHEHGVEHHGIAHHPHASGHGICPPWAGVPTSWNRTASNRATWVVVRGFF